MYTAMSGCTKKKSKYSVQKGVFYLNTEKNILGEQDPSYGVQEYKLNVLLRTQKNYARFVCVHLKIVTRESNWKIRE